MKWANSYFLYLLLLLPIVVGFLWWGEKLYKEKCERFIADDLRKNIVDNISPQRRMIKLVLIVLVFIFSVIAIARPQWGYELQEIKRRGIDILVVVDTSKSMLTQDVKPNRLSRTKLAIKDLIKKLQGDRIGLIAFSGDAFLVCPLTVDYNGFLLSLNDLDTNTISRGGTNLAVAIERAIDSYKTDDYQVKNIIIVTDGDNLEGNPLKAAKKAKDKGIKVYTIGIGTKAGELIRINGRLGQEEYLKDAQGNYVKSRLNEKLLQRIAINTGAFYVKSSGARFGLDDIYERELSKLQKQDFESKMKKRYYERFQIPLGIAFLLLVGESCLFTRKRFKRS